MTRDGITASQPTGSSWTKIPDVNFKHVSVSFATKIFALDKGGAIFYLEGLFSFSFDRARTEWHLLGCLEISIIERYV